MKLSRERFSDFLGPNGAGKTTTLMMLATLLPPTSGTALVNGFDVVKQAGMVRKSIGIVFQEPSSDDILTGYENLKLHARMYGVKKAIREQRINEVLTMVDIADRRNDLVRHYSGGMRRRLEIARGLLHRPRVLFLDEPTLGLDPSGREQAWSYIEKLVKSEKITVIITTHYMDEADKLCDRIAIIDRGKIVALDSPTELKKKLGGDIIKLKGARQDGISQAQQVLPLTTIDSLKGLNFVKNIEVIGNIVSITVEDASKHLQNVLEIVGKVESVEIHSPTLDDVFLHYTGREFREDGGAEGGWSERMMSYSAKGK